MGIFKKKIKPYARPINRAIASRAIFNENAGELHRIEILFELANGERIAFDLTLEQSALLIEQTTAAYRAILPPLRTASQGWGG